MVFLQFLPAIQILTETEAKNEPVKTILKLYKYPAVIYDKFTRTQAFACK